MTSTATLALLLIGAPAVLSFVAPRPLRPPAARLQALDGLLVAAPLVLALGAAGAAAVFLDGATDADADTDPAPWSTTSAQWRDSPDSILASRGSARVGTHAEGAWRTLRVNGSVQSVTRWDVASGGPLPLHIGNEYLKTMASAAADANPSAVLGGASVLFLGLGGGTLPSLFARQQHARLVCVDIDEAVAELAVSHCGLDASRVQVEVGDALDYVSAAADDTYDLVFVDIFDAENLCPLSFTTPAFADSVNRVLKSGGAAVMNHHCGNPAEDGLLEATEAAWRDAFGGGVTTRRTRYQANAVLSATKGPPQAGPGAVDVAREVEWPWDVRLRL